ncbi:hypothetical protein HYX14_01900 [Candidatus Woesearchaeota archaeon]|nr:hypothetical protein [Candidatus Woesearchaeota archaeon]
MLVQITPDREKAKSILQMADNTLQILEEMDSQRFPSQVAKEYYETIWELLSIVFLLDGYKCIGEYAHKELIESAGKKYLAESEVVFLDDLRILRNKISYDGIFFPTQYVERNKITFLKIIGKLQRTIKEKL